MYLDILHRGIRASWFPLVVFVIHVVLSRGFDAYTVRPWVDIPMHTLGGVAITYFCAMAFRGLELQLFTNSKQGYPIYLLFLFALTGMITGLWEFAEFLADHFFDAGAQKSLPDTMLDMALGFAGALVFLVPYALRRTKQQSSRIEDSKSKI
jgi:hypothetical protein